MVEELDESEDSQTTEWLVVGIHREEHAMYDLLLSYAEAVHIHGEPCKWFIESIIKRTPKLTKVRVIPAYAHLVDADSEAGKFLAEHNVEVVVGRIGDKRKDRTDFTTTSYRDKRYFMLRLDEERKRLLEDLKQYAPDLWDITSRYLCLGGEKHIPLIKLAAEKSVSTNHVTEVVGTVLYHLDSPFDAALASVRRARVLEERIKRGKEEEKEAEAYRARLKTLGLAEEDVPNGISSDYLEQYSLIFKAWKRDELSEMWVTSRERLVLMRRYGLEDKQFRSLEEVGQELGVTRERIRQIESSALKNLRNSLPSS